MSLPIETVEIAWDSGFSTAEGSRTWTDVSAYVEGDAGTEINYGRADELSTPEANYCRLTLDNRDGRFTPEKTGGAYYPNVKKGKPLRVSVRYTEAGSGNFLSANQASMETSIADWTAGGSVPPTLASSTTHADNGTKALRITWGTGGTTPLAQTTVTGLSVGRTYTAQARVWVTSGTPDVMLAIAGISTGTATTTKGAFASISITFVATASSHLLQVWPATAPTSGQQCWVDSVMVDEGSATGTFTTSAPPIHVRFTGYVDEWPLVWPDGSSAASTVTISATSRRARLGHTATLTYSPIRYAYALPDWPQEYWPMDSTRLTRTGQETFIDVTNLGTPTEVTEGRLRVVADTTALFPTFDESAAGPVDENVEFGMLKFPKFTDAGLLGTRPHTVDGGGCCKVNTAGEMTFEVVTRIDAPPDESCLITLVELLSRDGHQWIIVDIANAGSAAYGYIALQVMLTDDAGTTLVVNEEDDNFGAVYAAVNDGELHHFAVTVTSSNVVDLYVDGVATCSVTMPAPYTYDDPFTDIAMGGDTWMATAWIGHAAVRDEALTPTEIAAHASAATTANESIEERLQRLAGYAGVPAAEVEAEDSVVIDVGDQPQKDRAPVDLGDELAASTAGVLYDSRVGHLVMQARNHRYNQTSAFTLNATTQEVEGDLSAVLDDRYLVNYITVSRAGTDDTPYWQTSQTSVDAYGFYNTSIEMVTTSWDEARSAASHALVRYAEPEVRISNVSVDVVNLSTAQQTLVLAADIGTLFNLASLPSQAPTDPMPLYLEGYTETITPTGHMIAMNTTPGGWFTNVGVLDDASHDQLDSGITLAY